LRLRLPTPVGSPHVHSSLLVPVSFAGFLIKCIRVYWPSPPQCRFAGPFSRRVGFSSRCFSLCRSFRFFFGLPRICGATRLSLAGYFYLFFLFHFLIYFISHLRPPVVVAFGHPLLFMFPGPLTIPWPFWPVFSMTCCIFFCKWPAVSRRSPRCELRASRAAVPPLSAPESTIASTYFLSPHSLSAFPVVHTQTALLPCPSVLRRPEAGAGHLFSSLRDSRTCTNLGVVVSSARRQWPRPWLRSVAWLHGPFYSFQNSRTFMSNARFVATWSSHTRAGSARRSRCHFCFVSPAAVTVLPHQRLP
jgi:hypothetical protein